MYAGPPNGGSGPSPGPYLRPDAALSKTQRFRWDGVPTGSSKADLDAVVGELIVRDYEPLIETGPYPLGGRRRIYLIGHGGYLTAGRVGWLLSTPGRRPRSLRDAEGRWVMLDASPADVASAVLAADRK